MKCSRFFSPARTIRLLRGACCIWIGVLLVGAQGAWAQCATRFPARAQTINIGMGNVIIPDDLPLNGIIASRGFTVAASPGWYCGFGGYVTGAVQRGTSLGSEIYSTAVPGVGIRMTSSQDGRYPNRDVTPQGTTRPIRAGTITVELIKTAAVVGTGALAAGTYTILYGDGDGPGLSMVSTTLGANATRLIVASCAVDVGSRNIPVQFGKVPQGELKGQGTSAAERNFNIQLNCRIRPGGLNTVTLRMDAQTDTPATPGVLSLTAGTGAARGVGIQVLDGSRAPVKFGENADVGPAKNGSYVLPYTARYYQTAATVTPGQANGTATFTLDYK